MTRLLLALAAITVLSFVAAVLVAKIARGLK